MKKMDSWTIFALALIFIGNVGGILIVVVQSINSAKDKDQIIQTTNSNNQYLKEQLETITKEREVLKSDLTIRDADNREKSEEIIQLNRELLNQSEKLNKFLGASDAYSILLVSSLETKIGLPSFTFTIKNEFAYPLYDVEINVINFQFILENSIRKDNTFTITKENFTKSIIFQKDNNQILAKSEVITSEEFQIQNGVLHVKLKSRNTFVFEKIAFVQVGKTIFHGFMVYDGNGKILKKWFGTTSKEIQVRLEEKFDSIPLHYEMNFVK